MMYFIIGAVLVVTGQLDVNQAGVVSEFVLLSGGDVAVNSSINSTGALSNYGGPLKETVQFFGGLTVAFFSIIKGFAVYLGWPLTVWPDATPWQVTYLVGGTLVAGFAISLIKVFRS